MVLEMLLSCSGGLLVDATSAYVEIGKCLWTQIHELVNTTDPINLNTIVQSGNGDMIMHDRMIYFKKNNKKC